MQAVRSVWKEAAWVFGLSRLVIFLVSCFAVVVFPLAGQSLPVNCSAGLDPCIHAWYRWDAIAYIRVAYQGYSYTPDVAFFPLWPLLEHFGGLLLGGLFPNSYYFAGLLLANICFYFALVLLYYLLSEDYEQGIARGALFYFAFSPYALFYFAGYTESLFVLLCLAIFLLLRRGRPLDWWLVGILGFLAALTRSPGIILVIPFLVKYIQSFWTPVERSLHSWGQKLSALAPVVLIPAGIVVYMLFLYYAKGSALLFISQEATSGWHRHLTFPWVGIASVVGSVFVSGIGLQNILDLSFTLIPLMVLALGWKRIPLHYALFSLGLALFTLSFPQSAEPLSSQPRYMLILFPVTVIFALWGKRPRFDQLFLTFSLPLLALNIIIFIGHY